MLFFLRAGVSGNTITSFEGAINDRNGDDQMVGGVFGVVAS